MALADVAGAAMLGQSPLNWAKGAVKFEPVRQETTEGLAGLDDAALVRACLDGQTDAFGVIVERHQRAVYHLCYRFAGSHEDASDLAQDVFLRAYRGLRRFRGDAALSMWLYRIGVNVCLNKVSARVPVMTPLDDVPGLAAPGQDPSSAVVREERVRRVRQAVARLPRKQRVTLMLRVYQDLSHKEIAVLLHTNVGAVKANCFHALANLKRLLAGRESEDQA